MDLVFRDIEVTIGNKTILKKVSGVAENGEMLAIMGPSGAGKSTLLNAIAGRLPISGGSITLNNKILDKRLGRKMRFVLQNDLFFPTLTLMETITFAALLTLPEKMPHDKKLQRVEEIIQLLELDDCKHTAIGNQHIPGLSGGERKRATIACEIIADPSVVLVDEPTSGLDYSIASNLITTLKKYSQTKTVVVTIHQPSSQMFHMFTNVLLISRGQTIFFGECSKIVDHYQKAGLVCKPQYNPADFIMEELRASAYNEARLIQEWQNTRHKETSRYLQNAPATAIASQNNYAVNGVDNPYFCDFTESYEKHDEKSTEDIKSKLEIESNTGDAVQNTEILPIENRDGSKSLRTNEIVRKHSDQHLKWQTAIIWFQLGRTEETLSDRNGFLFFTIVRWGFNTLLGGLATFQEERPIIERERAAGLYRLSAYWTAKQTSELPLIITMPIVHTLICYFAVGLTLNVWVFIGHVIQILNYILAVQGLAMLLGVLIADLHSRMASGDSIFIMSMLVAGFFQQNLSLFTSWISYFSPVKYAYNGLLILEYRYGESIRCLSDNSTAYNGCVQNNNYEITGNDVLKKLDVHTPLWITFMVLLAMSLTFRYFSYLVMRYWRKPKTYN